MLAPFHVVKLCLSYLDEVRRRVQQDSTGHRGRTGDPLYGIRRVLRRRRDRLSAKARARLEAGLIAGDPTGETTLVWTVAQDLMKPLPAHRSLTRPPPIHVAYRTARPFDHADVTNEPTENLNHKIKNTKRIAHGYRNFTHYRLRLLLNHGRIHEDHTPTRIRTRRPRFIA